MDIESIFSTNTILQSLTVGISVYFIRIWLESKWISLQTSPKFKGIALPSIALLISFLISFFVPFGQLKEQLPAEKIASALICGFSSGYVFSIIKAFLKKQSGIESIPPEKNNE